VLGIDNYAVARTSLPPLSSIHAPGEVVGYQALGLLDRLMRGEAAGNPVVEVPATKLVVRNSTGPRGAADSEIVRALALVRERACDGVGIEEILDDLHVSRSTLERQFLAAVGRTPGQELMRARLDRAKDLLRNTDLPVSRVAEMTGYQRSSNFSDFFRKHTGVSPSDFRDGGVTDTEDGKSSSDAASPVR
jgi:LacI family transcriptional regulator